jgi:hypothetical protein
MSDWRTPSWTGKRQPNPYSVLEEGHYTPREKSGPSKEKVGIDQQIWYPTAMSDGTTKGATVKSIAGYLTKSKVGHLVMKPLEEPTKVDLITFKTNVGTALLKCKSTNEGGHVYLKIMNSDKQSEPCTTGSANPGQTGMETDRDRPSEGDLARSTRYHKTTVQAEEGMECEER